MTPNRMFILYDARACGGGGSDDATVLVSCHSDKECPSCGECNEFTRVHTQDDCCAWHRHEDHEKVKGLANEYT